MTKSVHEPTERFASNMTGSPQQAKAAKQTDKRIRLSRLALVHCILQSYKTVSRPVLVDAKATHPRIPDKGGS